MNDRSAKHPPEVTDLLAPPPFGVAEITSDQLLPIATSMEQVLDEAALPQPERAPVILPSPESEPESTVADPVAAVDHGETVPTSKRPLVVAGIVLVLLGTAGFLWMNRGGDGAEDRPGQADTGAVSQAASGVPSEGVVVPPDGAQAQIPALPVEALPTDLDALRKLSFEERHAGLAHASGEVPVELHVGLDLVQAQQSDEPCRTFSDALSSIESSEDTVPFDWAVEEASLPIEDDSTSCAGLAERLAAAKHPRGEVKAPKARPRTPRRKQSSKRGQSRPDPVVDPPPRAEPAKTTAPTTPKPPPAREAPSVATKLDDDLRGLGE